MKSLILLSNLVFLSSLFFVQTAYSQSVYSGKIVDTGGEKVAFAQVFFNLDQKYGAVTNEEGEFSLKIREVNKSDSLVVSILGYETLLVAYADLPKNAPIVLSQAEIVLDEVIIRSDTYLRHLLKESLQAIPLNYPTDKHLLKAYYQDYTLSDSTYTEMIEADLSLLSSGYHEKEVKQQFYLKQLRKTEDRRYLPQRLKTDRNKVISSAKNYNFILSRAFSRFSFAQDHPPTLEEFVNNVDELKSLEVHTQYVQQGDTILTIKIGDSVLRILDIDKKELEALYGLISINLTDKAIVKVVYGNIWSDEANFGVMAYRKIDGKYYPSYLRSVMEFEHDQKTHHHYNSRSLFFYDLVTGDKTLRKYKKGKKLRPEKGLRLFRSKVDEDFWSTYARAYNVEATTLLRSKFGFVR